MVDSGSCGPGSGLSYNHWLVFISWCLSPLRSVGKVAVPFHETLGVGVCIDGGLGGGGITGDMLTLAGIQKLRLAHFEEMLPQQSTVARRSCCSIF